MAQVDAYIGRLLRALEVWRFFGGHVLHVSLALTTFTSPNKWQLSHIRSELQNNSSLSVQTYILQFASIHAEAVPDMIRRIIQECTLIPSLLL